MGASQQMLAGATGAAAGPNVAFVSAANGANTSTNTSFTITVPTVSTGDLLVVIAIDRAGSSGDKPAIADNDSGSYTVAAEVAPTAGGWASVWWRYATSATSAKTITVSSLASGAPSGCAVLLVFTNVHQTTPINVLNPPGTGLASGTNQVSAVTPTYSGGALITAVGIRNTTTFTDGNWSTASQGALTEPANADVSSSVGSGSAVGAAYKLNPALSTTGVISWTPGSNASSAAFVFELQKAP